MTERVELKPCRECGYVPDVIIHPDNYRMVQCQCGEETSWHYAEAESIAAWNRRAEG